MSRLESLVAKQTSIAMTDTMRMAIQDIAHEIAREILSDEAFRAQMHDFITASCHATMTHLNTTPARPAKKKARKKK